MNDALNVGVFVENAVKSLIIAKIYLIELGANAGDGLNAIQHDGLTVAEVIHDDGSLPCLNKLNDGLGTDKAGTACNKNGHNVTAFLSK